MVPSAIAHYLKEAQEAESVQGKVDSDAAFGVSDFCGQEDGEELLALVKR